MVKFCVLLTVKIKKGAQDPVGGQVCLHTTDVPLVEPVDTWKPDVRRLIHCKFLKGRKDRRERR
jgi:hypothetical protein